MDGPEMSEEELERKLRAFLRQEAAKYMPPEGWWEERFARLRERVEEQRRNPWYRLRRAFQGLYSAPLPMAAAGLVLMVAVSAAVVLALGFPVGGKVATPALGQERLSPTWNVNALPGTPAGAASSPFMSINFGEASVIQATPAASAAQPSTDTQLSLIVQPDGQATTNGPSIESGWLAAGCTASNTTLASVGFAFDGTATQVTSGNGGERVLFQVRHWYRGGDSPYVLVQMEAGNGAHLPAQGERWLVAGARDGAGSMPAQGCGPSRRYTDAAARQWQQELGK